MENIAPPLACILFLEQKLSEGIGLRAALVTYFTHFDNSFSRDLNTWYLEYSQKKSSEIRFISPYREALRWTLIAGLNGQPILKILQELRIETISATERELETYLQKLPLRSLVPLLTLLFPAYLILLLGPVLSQLVELL